MTQETAASYSATPAAPTAEAAKPSPAARLGAFAASCKMELGVAFLLLILGVTLRLMPSGGTMGQTVDEHLYITNVRMLQKVGVLEYPAIVAHYVEVQSKMQMVMLPPTRCLYVVSGYLWASVTGADPLTALRSVAAAFSILTLLLAGIAAARMGGRQYGLAVFALMAVAPMELQMAHHELVDGFFSFWALLSFWLLWENLQRPGKAGWLAAYAVAIACMVMTKENSFFAFVGLSGILALTPALKLGKITRETLVATVGGAALGVCILICISGGIGMFISTYRLLVTKAEAMDFAYETGGGPWFRYIVDLMLLSPLVMLAAIGGALNLRRENKSAIFLLLFVVFSYVLMANVRNGMNARYATMWDMPLRFLAVTQLLRIAACVRRAPQVAATALVTLAGLVDVRQYYIIFGTHDSGEVVTYFLLQALQIIRFAHH